MTPLTDSLTSLGNRQLLEKDLAVYEGQVVRYGLRICIALIHVNDFETFVERYGRTASDRAIVALAERLANGSRLGDAVYRVDENEFVCLLPEQSVETGALAVNRMIQSFGQLEIPHEDTPSGLLRVSAGLVLLDAEHVKPAAELLADAKAALEPDSSAGDAPQDGPDA